MEMGALPDYLHIDPKELTVQKFHHLMLGAIAPRPIALASTIDGEGRPNLSPFSFFNAFGANPPVIIFSPSRRGIDNTTKHTYENIKEVPEVVINAVTYSMVRQVSDASADFAKGVNEFEMVGLTMEPSELIRPFRVRESPAQFECRVMQVIETGTGPAAGNLVICEILRMHINPAVMDENGRIDPDRIDLVGRLGGDLYVRASGQSLFVLPKPR
jgi:flavin reductase (DIM6/NTAB) family NADH-FMN oxidoreductase RutF